MSNMLLIIDISHDSVVVSEFDMLRLRPDCTELYSLMNFRDINHLLDHHFRKGVSFVPKACCIVCNSINTDEWIIPTHNPQMRVSVSQLKAGLGTEKIFFLSPAEALSFSALAPEAGGMQHLTGIDSLAGEGAKFMVESRDRFSCRLLSKDNSRWQSSHIRCDELDISSDDEAINKFRHQYGNGALLKERGLVMLYGYFCARNDRQAECLTYSDVLINAAENQHQESQDAIKVYFDLLRRFFEVVGGLSSAKFQDIAFIVHTTQPALFAVNYRQYLAALCGNSPVHSVFLDASETPRLYGAAAWVSQYRLAG